MRPKILVTGGPVHGKLDAVKIITNKFKGGMMAGIADSLQAEGDVTYITVKGMAVPKAPGVKILHHDGIDDYLRLVMELAPSMDAVVLGAAVANLVPAHPLAGKFPSHNYKEGDTFPIEFKIAPRVIDRVKKVAPNTKLFGFKLLAGVPHEELIEAAHGVALESKAEAVFANDATDLVRKFAVTKERSVIPVSLEGVPRFILDRIQERHYLTQTGPREVDPIAPAAIAEAEATFASLRDSWGHRFAQEGAAGYMFGSIAVRIPGAERAFLTTLRGKKDLEGHTIVFGVDHQSRMVFAERKATLNAPLLDTVFRNNPEATAVIHLHEVDAELPLAPYASPGTDADSCRGQKGAFFIEHHGSILPLGPTHEVIR